MALPVVTEGTESYCSVAMGMDVTACTPSASYHTQRHSQSVTGRISDMIIQITKKLTTCTVATLTTAFAYRIFTHHAAFLTSLPSRLSLRVHYSTFFAFARLAACFSAYESA